jgi:hypothetical protein
LGYPHDSIRRGTTAAWEWVIAVDGADSAMLPRAVYPRPVNVSKPPAAV